MWTLCFCICLCWYSMIWKEKSFKFCLPSKNTFSLIERWNNFCLIWNRFGQFLAKFLFCGQTCFERKEKIVKCELIDPVFTSHPPRSHKPDPNRTFLKVQKNAPMTKDDVEFSVDRLSKNQEKPKWINTV